MLGCLDPKSQYIHKTQPDLQLPARALGHNSETVSRLQVANVAKKSKVLSFTLAGFTSFGSVQGPLLETSKLRPDPAYF